MNADGYLTLRVASEMYWDAQKHRIALGNRIGNAPIDSDLFLPLLEGAAASEHQMGLLMRRIYRRVVDPEIVAWQKATLGIGEHLLARLLGAVGHPLHTTVHQWQGEGAERVLVVLGTMERRVSDLWSYCGHGDPTRRPKKGMSADDAAASGNPGAKMLVRLIAEGCMKNMRSPYRAVYDEGRERYATREDWTPAHQHNAALRLTGKAVLKDLWRVARGEV